MNTNERAEAVSAKTGSKGNPNMETEEVADRSRRRALLTGLAAAPAVLTLFGRPLWAQTPREASDGICQSLSAASSLHIGDEDLAKKCEEFEAAKTAEQTSETLPSQ